MKTSGFRRRGGARAQPAKVRRAPIPSRLVGAIVLSGLCCVPVFADDQSLREGARDAGRATGSAFHDLGQGAKQLGIEIGHAAADAGKKVGHGFAEMGRTIGAAAKEGGKEFWHAIKGGG